MNKITIPKPDDFHLHLRDGEMLKAVLPHTTNHFARAIIMPNLIPPITTEKQAMDYYQKIISLTKENFTPLMTLYLTENMQVEEIEKISKNEKIIGIKLYPQGATTNSNFGVGAIEKIYHLFEAMEKNHVPLLIHGEVTDKEIDIFDREKIFIERVLQKIIEKFPHLKITLEHITTKDAVDFIKESREKIAASITIHHLLLDRNDLLVGGIKPHYYCLPILKKNHHRKALCDVVLSGNSKFFLGTDSAPHTKDNKESACGCAGVFSAPVAMPLLIEWLQENNALHLLENFCCRYGAKHYNLPINHEKITFIKKEDLEEDLEQNFLDEKKENLQKENLQNEFIKIDEKNQVAIFDSGKKVKWQKINN